MREKFHACTFLYLTRKSKIDPTKTQVLLQLRRDTGYMDGKYDLAVSGHVEKGENLKQAIRRESKEEIGINISCDDDLRFLMLVDAPEEGYLKAFFEPMRYSGEPKVCEPNKCGGLIWADIDRLPKNIIPYLPAVIEFIQKGIFYATSSSLYE